MAEDGEVMAGEAEELPENGESEASDDPAPGEEPAALEEPAEVEEPEVDEASAPWSKLPGWAIGAITVLAIAGFGWIIWKGWDYIVTSDEAAEKEDWEQLLGLIDRVDNLALFVLGAVFGVAVQARQTSDARRAADKNKKEVTKQHSKAKRNERAARKNQRVARGQARLANDALAKVRKAERVIDEVGRDQTTLFLQGRDLQQSEVVGRRMRAALDAQGVKPEDLEVGATDPRLEELAGELDDFLARAEQRRLRAT